MKEQEHSSNDFKSYSVQQFAKEFNISEQTVKTMIKKGNIRSFRFTDNGHYHIPIEEVLRYRRLYKLHA